MNIGVCDDDIVFAEKLSDYLYQYSKKKKIKINVEIFQTPQELYEYMKSHTLELLFLDIELGSSTGVEVGNYIRSDLKNETIQIVFVSAKESYAMQLFDIRPMNFLVKPVSYQKAEYILNEYIRLFDYSNHFFCYSVRKEKKKVSEQSIFYFRSSGRKITMYTQDGEDEFYGKMAEVASQLQSPSFCITHKSYIINMNYVKRYYQDYVIMVNDDEVPISRTMKKHVSQKILQEKMGE